MASHNLSYTAQYARTRNGTWGVRITGKLIEDAATGDEVEVQVKRKNGEVNTHRVNIFWMGNNRYDKGKVALASILQADSQSGTAKRSHHAEPDGTVPFHSA